jgi:hypothetical protein
VQNIQAADNVDEVFREPSEMGQERFRLVGLYSGDDECVIGYGLIDSSEVNLSAANETLYSIVVLTSQGEAANDQNPTPWLLFDEGTVLWDGEAAELDLVESLEAADQATIVDTSCGTSS